MKRVLFFLLLISSSLFCDTTYKRSEVTKTPTFELLMGSFNERDQKWRTYRQKDLADLAFYSSNYYDKIGLLHSGVSSVERIPHVIHFIWVGPKPYPENSVANVQSWKELHPDWKMLFWTDDPERPCPVEGMERHLIDEIDFILLKPYLSQTTNYAEKADVIRYELLYQQGGVYVDHDVSCLRPFDDLHSAYDFYACLENPHTNTGSDAKIFPCNCLFGARPRHPILLEAIHQVDQRWEEIGQKYPGLDSKSTFARVINRTFRSFTLAIENSLSIDGNLDMVLPSAYFFSNKIFNRTTSGILLKQGFVYATHAFASTWRDKKPTTSLKSKKKSSSEQSKA